MPSADLPKGMTPPAPTSLDPRAPDQSAPLTLADGNYAGAIRHALDILPVAVRIDRLVVLERAGQPPQVRLALTILGEKEEGGGDDERDGAEALAPGAGLCPPGR